MTDMTPTGRLREAFEAWHKSKFGDTSSFLTMHNPDGSYVYVQDEWEVWQAAALAERERCAKVCEEKAEWISAIEKCRPIVAKHWRSGARASAYAIRAG